MVNLNRPIVVKGIDFVRMRTGTHESGNNLIP